MSHSVLGYGRYWERNDPIINYCAEHTVKLHPLQHELREKTLAEANLSIMLGSSDVFTLGANFIHLISGKKVLDIGTYTGASALAWALAAGDDAQVFTFDISHQNYKKFGVPVISKCEKTFKKIIPVEGQALEHLDKMIADGQSGTFDFAFIDADKSLWFGRITGKIESDDTCTLAIDSTNKKIFNDDRTASALLNCGDGLHIAFKK